MDRSFASAYVPERFGIVYPSSIVQTSKQQPDEDFPQFQCTNLYETPSYSSNFSSRGFLPLSGFDSPTFGYFNDNYSIDLQTTVIGSSSLSSTNNIENQNQQLMMRSSRMTNFDLNKFKSMVVKAEPVEDDDCVIGLSIQPEEKLNQNRSLDLLESNFYQLPSLQSLKQQQRPPPLKRFRVSQLSDDSNTLESIVRNIISPNPPSFISPNPPPQTLTRSKTRPNHTIPVNRIARERRKLISDRTRCLQKLMPWEIKMDMATMLEEACKYVKFLKAQVSVLESMPIQSASPMVHASGGLEKLNRQQLLEVVVNSPVAQTVMYSQECCVYSLEQVLSLINLQ